jgi:hypothetical protein
MELGNVRLWVHEYSQNLENSQRYGDENAMQPMNSNNELEQGYATQGDDFEGNQGLQEVAEVDSIIEELWEMMMKQSIWRRVEVKELVNQKFATD